jgi:hypothetical protein
MVAEVASTNPSSSEVADEPHLHTPQEIAYSSLKRTAAMFADATPLPVPNCTK